LVGHVIAEAL